MDGSWGVGDRSCAVRFWSMPGPQEVGRTELDCTSEPGVIAVQNLGKYSAVVQKISTGGGARTRSRPAGGGLVDPRLRADRHLSMAARYESRRQDPQRERLQSGRRDRHPRQPLPRRRRAGLHRPRQRTACQRHDLQGDVRNQAAHASGSPGVELPQPVRENDSEHMGSEMQRQIPRRIEAWRINSSPVLLASSPTTATEDSVSAIPHSLPGPVRD